MWGFYCFILFIAVIFQTATALPIETSNSKRNYATKYKENNELYPFVFNADRLAVSTTPSENIIETNPPLSQIETSDHMKEEGTFTNQVSIRSRINDIEPFDYEHICGGIIIGLTNVLTAANCLFVDNLISHLQEPEELMVVTGTPNQPLADNNSLVFDVKEYTIHPYFNIRKQINNIAIIYLEQSIPVGHPTVRPVPFNEDPDISRPGQLCKVAVWRKMSPSTYTMKIINVRIIPFDKCAEKYRNDVPYHMLCADHEDDYPKTGDIGSGLICDGFAVGLVSWGDPTKTQIKAAVYTDVQSYKHWIRANSADKNFPLFNIMLMLNFVVVVIY